MTDRTLHFSGPWVDAQGGEHTSTVIVRNPLRPSWDDYFLGLAKAVAARADCRRAQHGAVIVRSNRVVSTGYNGSPAGGKSCLSGECPRGLLSMAELPPNHADYSNCIALHAEQNAIAYARERGDTIYITGEPCDMCSKLIAAAGITRVVYPRAGSTASKGDVDDAR